jgi:RecA-family ATPase
MRAFITLLNKDEEGKLYMEIQNKSRNILDEAEKLSEENEKKSSGKNFDIIFADDLPTEFIPPDELIEGIITTGDSSMLYGDSNSGKTFFAIDMACAIALGIPWMGRKTEPGIVIYLAAESPASVKRRLQAYQKHHNLSVPNFVIVQNPYLMTMPIQIPLFNWFIIWKTNISKKSDLLLVILWPD